MKVHPVSNNPNNLTLLRYDVASNTCRQKKLRRLPHIFAKVLELPFHSDAEVSISETPNSLKFTASTDFIGPEVRADAIEIYPGVTKVVVRGNGVVDVSGFELELDLWRFRLPASTRTELAYAGYENGELIVIVPKHDHDDVEDEGVGAWNSSNRLVVLVE